LHYQWRTNGIPIAGATASSLTYSPAASANTIPSYDVVVTSPSSGLAVTSSVVTLTIRSAVDSLVWRGYGLQWDLTSGNWESTNSLSDGITYQQGDNVLFDDTAAGNFMIYLNGRIMPGSVTVNSTSNNYTFAGVGYLSWTMGLNVTGAGRLTLATVNDYSGDTTVNPASTLALSGAGSIANSANIILGVGATLNATARSDGTLTVNASQTLKGHGTFNVTGSLANNGVLEFNISKLSGVVTNDRLQGITGIQYGGTLKLDLSGEPLAGGDTIKLFNATTYAGGFASIVPATPGTGLTWDTSTLPTSGTLGVVATVTVNTTPTNIVGVVSGTNLTLTWPADHTGWRLQAQTNGLGTNWFDVSGANATNQVVIPINQGNGSVFFRLVYP
jgi:autotransporter-associated beta strand protein